MFSNKMDIRKKAMESMSKDDAPSLPMSKKPEAGKEGFEQMMVSPEEKEMILAKRKGESGESDESPELDSGNPFAEE